MKGFIRLYLSLLFLASFIKTSRADGELCIPANVTYALCMFNDTGVAIVSKTFAADLLAEECHEHFTEELLGQPICHEHATEEGERKNTPSTAQRYGYGFLAVFIISILSLGGLLAFPCIYKISFQYVLATFTALAVGTLFGDVMFHLIPFTLGLHSHESHEDEHGHGHNGEEDHSSVTVPIYQWRMFMSVMILYGFYLLEIFLHWVANYRQNKNVVHSHDHIHTIQHTGTAKTDEMNNNSIIAINDNLAHDHHSHNHNYNELDLTLVSVGKSGTDHSNVSETLATTAKGNSNCKEIESNNLPKAIRATGWMIILGDGIHNFADGLAIGAAFSADLMLGLTTTIAIGCHELPHEFGDYAILIQAGFSHCRALFWNFVSATTAFIGFFVGAAVSTNEDARQWIFAVTIGMFLYIALVDLLPTLLPEGSFALKRFILVNVGYLLGVTIMFLLAVFEDKLLHVGQ